MHGVCVFQGRRLSPDHERAGPSVVWDTPDVSHGVHHTGKLTMNSKLYLVYLKRISYRETVARLLARSPHTAPPGAPSPRPAAALWAPGHTGSTAVAGELVSLPYGGPATQTEYGAPSHAPFEPPPSIDRMRSGSPNSWRRSAAIAQGPAAADAAAGPCQLGDP